MHHDALINGCINGASMVHQQHNRVAWFMQDMIYSDGLNMDMNGGISKRIGLLGPCRTWCMVMDRIWL